MAAMMLYSRRECRSYRSDSADWSRALIRSNSSSSDGPDMMWEFIDCFLSCSIIGIMSASADREVIKVGVAGRGKVRAGFGGLHHEGGVLAGRVGVESPEAH